MSNAFAQTEVVVGDMNDDGKITVSDVTTLVETLAGRIPQRIISTKCTSDISCPSVIAGEWKSPENSILILTEEGKATLNSNSSVTDFEYFPCSRDLILLDEKNQIVLDYHVLRLSNESVVFKLPCGEYATYYPSTQYATSLNLSVRELSLYTGKTHKIDVLPTPEGSIVPTVMWESSNSSIATVSSVGLVTAVSTGSCTITAKANGGDWIEKCNLTVKQSVESITLSSNLLTLDLHKEQRLTATVLPSNAADPTYTWSSSDESIAEVSKGGMVYTNGYGSCVITATANDGSGVMSECIVNVTRTINGHSFVDLGLPSKTVWAKCNVGASKPEDYGTFFAWGETSGQTYSTSYQWNTYKYSSNLTKYNSKDEKSELAPTDDAAYVRWGSGWLTPSDEQFSELCNSCTWIWDATKKGYEVIGPNGNSIFLPAGGSRCGGELNVGTSGSYWSRILCSDDLKRAYYLSFGKSSHSVYKGERCYGHSVRPCAIIN